MDRWFHRPAVTAAAAVSTVVLATAAFGYWITTGTGTGVAATPAVQAITLSAATPSGQLIPGGQADVAVSIANPNPFQVRVGTLTLDSTQGTGGFAVDAGHSGCGLDVLSFTAQSNGGDGWYVPAQVGGVDGTLSIDLTGAAAMTSAAANACQGATFTVHLDAHPDYHSTVLATSGLVSYWRLGAGPTAAENFTDTAATTLQTHSGAVSTTWTLTAGSNAVISDANRLRRASTTHSGYEAGVTPPGADYAVRADIVAKSLISGDGAAVVGRLNSATNTGYAARYQTSDNTWRLIKIISGVETSLGSSVQALTLDHAYQVRLDMIGSALTLSVDGTVVASATDSAITAAGRAGLRLGIAGNSVATGDSAGLHVDNFRIVANTGASATDSSGSNVGTLTGAPVLNGPGAIAGDLNGATTFNGTSSYLQVAGPTGLPTGAASRSVELWFRGTSTANQALFAYGSLASAQMFGALLTTPTNLQVWGAGVNRDFTLPGAVNDGAWHHLVVTYNGSLEQVHIDGTALVAQVATLNTTLDATGLGIGAVLPTGDPNSGRYFDGAIDDVAIYNHTLSVATIVDHYRLGSGVS